MLLYDMTGTCCGNFEGATAPAGYWLRADDAPTSMDPLAFMDKLGPTNFGVVWQAMAANPSLAYAGMRGFAAQSIILADSFPVLIQMEAQNLLPAGTAIQVWS